MIQHLRTRIHNLTAHKPTPNTWGHKLLCKPQSQKQLCSSQTNWDKLTSFHLIERPQAPPHAYANENQRECDEHSRGVKTQMKRNGRAVLSVLFKFSLTQYTKFMPIKVLKTCLQNLYVCVYLCPTTRPLEDTLAFIY